MLAADTPIKTGAESVGRGRSDAFTDHLAYADAGRGERWFAGAVALVAVAMVVCVAPVARVALPEVEAFLPAVGSMTVLALVLTAVLLTTQFRVVRHPPLAILAFTYFAAAFVGTCNLVTIPSGVPLVRIFGGHSQTAVWLYVFFHFVFAGGVLVSLLMEPSTTREQSRSWLAPSLVAAGVAVAAVTLGILRAGSDLPAILGPGGFSPMWTRVFPAAFGVLAVCGLATFYLLTRVKKVIHVWLGVVIVASVCDTLVTGVLSSARYSAGWYVGRIEWLIASGAFLIVLLVHINQIVMALTRGNRVLLQQTMSDALTGLLNRRAFDAELFNGVRRARANRSVVSLLVIDIDDFKAYNDGFGHPAGDIALQAVAGAMLASVARPDDACCRIGGEELAVVLPDTTLEGAAAVAERIRRAVANLRIAHAANSGLTSMTISIGAASTETDPSLGADGLFAAADRALYEAKEAGKNRVAVSDVSYKIRDAS
jgi:diguanylate cyclase (GGDEF)-like protein